VFEYAPAHAAPHFQVLGFAEFFGLEAALDRLGAAEWNPKRLSPLSQSRRPTPIEDDETDETGGRQSSKSGKDLRAMAQVVIASRLSDGLVVFLKETTVAGPADWVLQLSKAEVADNDERAAELLAIAEADAAKTQSVIDVYLIDVEEEGGELRPTKYREVIRCLGPTIRLDLGKQAEGPEA
jgi:hypothetical protein